MDAIQKTLIKAGRKDLAQKYYHKVKSYGNPDVPKNSNWYRFAKKFDIGVLDLDKFASLMGLKNFKNLDISISPKDLFKRDKNKFNKALKQSSLMAEDMTPMKIMKLVMLGANELESKFVDIKIEKTVEMTEIPRYQFDESDEKKARKLAIGFGKALSVSGDSQAIRKKYKVIDGPFSSAADAGNRVPKSKTIKSKVSIDWIAR